MCYCDEDDDDDDVGGIAVAPPHTHTLDAPLDDALGGCRGVLWAVLGLSRAQLVISRKDGCSGHHSSSSSSAQSRFCGGLLFFGALRLCSGSARADVPSAGAILTRDISG